MLCLSLLWRGLLMMATSGLKTKSSLCSKWRLVQCQAPHAVPGSALGLLKTHKMLLVELNCSAVAEYIQANRTVPQSTLDLPLCRARRFSVVSARPKHTMKKNPTASTLLSCGWDKHQKKRWFLPVTLFQHGNPSHSEQVITAGTGGRAAPGKQRTKFSTSPVSKHADTMPGHSQPSTAQENHVTPCFAPASPHWSVRSLGGSLQGWG